MVRVGTDAFRHRYLRVFEYLVLYCDLEECELLDIFRALEAGKCKSWHLQSLSYRNVRSAEWYST